MHDQPLKWSALNPVGRAIIVAIAALTLAVAAVAFATSYGALYAWVRDTGLYSERLARIWPLLLDAAFIIAQLAAILGGILRGNRAWPILTMLVSGSLTIWFNLQHAGADPGRRLAAALPPVLMILAFEIDVQIVKWVMRALGKPLGQPVAPPPAAGMPASLPPGVWQPIAGGWPNVPPAVLNTHPALGQVPSPTSSENPQNPQMFWGAGSGNGDQAETTKRQQVEAYLAQLDPGQLPALTARQLAADLTDHGMDVSERYVARILDQWTAARQGSARTQRKTRKR